MDFFKARVNRIAAWAIDPCIVLRTTLLALLEPIDRLREVDVAGDSTAHLALLEELQGQP